MESGVGRRVCYGSEVAWLGAHPPGGMGKVTGIFGGTAKVYSPRLDHATSPLIIRQNPLNYVRKKVKRALFNSPHLPTHPSTYSALSDPHHGHGELQRKAIQHWFVVLPTNKGSRRRNAAKR